MEKLKENRTIDDRIIHELNTTIPTTSFAANVNVTEKCKSLYDMVVAAHDVRNNAIKVCIENQALKTKKLKDLKDQNPDDFQIRKQLGREQTNLRLFQQESTIEKITQERAKKAFYERCRNYYTAPGTS
uniref:Protein MIX23 n=1 Tax=Ciona savignyi TaxID=51511 RepID=H2YKT4_CIOSA